MSDLASWNDGPTRQAIVEFAETAVRDVPPEERIAVFDNDGTLWCEKPMPVELGFILRRLAAMAEADASLRETQPWKAARERDYAWLGGAMDKHYGGDDADMKLIIGGVLRAFAGHTVEAYAAAAIAFLDEATHPTLSRRFRDCWYVPMVELLRYLESNDFDCFIASGGQSRLHARHRGRDLRDPARAGRRQLERAPLRRRRRRRSARVPGRARRLRRRAGEAGAHLEPDRPPSAARGRNSNGDVPMLQYAAGPSRSPLRLLVRHDDAEREFDYTRGADAALARAGHDGWHVVSVKRDWAVVFADGGGL
jgi:phosphoserine phosphatase